ncbi:hypothetical protein Tco_0496691 [Tanacetum coccineum]
MDDPNITMEEYMRLQEEKALSRGETFNWQTATYDKREYCNDEDDSFINFETEFPAIVFDDITSNTTLFCESTVSSLNDNEINFRISFDKSNDEDYTIIYDENSFSYKIIYVNNLKTDSENDNDKVNMPLFPTSEPEVSYSNDLDFFKDFENEFPAIVYNDALTSKSDFLTEPTISPQHIDEFNLKNETSLSKCDEEEQNVLYFNDLFHFNVIYPDDLKRDTDNVNDEIDIEQPSGDMSVIPLPNVINVDVGASAQGSNKLSETSHDTSNKFFNTETFIKKLNVNIVSSATREYPSLIHTFFLTHTVGGVFLNHEDKALYNEMLRLHGLGSNTSTSVPYTEDEIMAIVREGKQRRHIPGVGRVLPGQGTVISHPPPCTHSSDVAKLKKSEKRLTKQVKMFMKLFRSDDKFSHMLTQLEPQPEYGGGSGSGGCRDD